ncbi:mitogen-activated protein kinase kinase kinase kinase 4-like [Xenopus tropicalis]|uniref:Mitogen-activated protein kinase kinase kinase kinase 4-like n=1 Tax=Xenopus tropicalis TaxID=8364 RepID=A0A8J1JVI0_XENTR|nr:mitogen-activated protein kinase kinase kinase kinase 4-like [Xenopus tropicalis]
MEYCGGGSLADIISSTRNQSLPERSIQYISREVLKGLDYIHNNLVIHTDIKGANIVLTEQAEVKIIDFGLAKEIRYPGQRVSEYSGTPWYMAPEVIITLYLPEIGYTVKCDIWSFGITIIEMAQGDPPNRDMPAERAKINIFRGDPPELKSKRWSTDIRDFLKLCLTKADQERPGAKVLLRHQFITNQPNENEARLAFIQCLNEVSGQE